MSPNGRVRTITALELHDRYMAGGVSYRQLGAEARIHHEGVRQLVNRVARQKRQKKVDEEQSGAMR